MMIDRQPRRSRGPRRLAGALLFGVLLAQNEAFRLLMHKYDWIEKHPELEYRVARKAVPWAELLANERETLGDRSLLHFIFPWKD